jgi:hypothetical protein
MMKNKISSNLCSSLLNYLGFVDLIYGIYFLFFPIPLKIDLSEIGTRIGILILYVLSANAVWRFLNKKWSVRVRFYNMPISIVYRFVVAYFVVFGSVKAARSIDCIPYVMTITAVTILILWKVIIYLRPLPDEP